MALSLCPRSITGGPGHAVIAQVPSSSPYDMPLAVSPTYPAGCQIKVWL